MKQRTLVGRTVPFVTLPNLPCDVYLSEKDAHYFIVERDNPEQAKQLKDLLNSHVHYHVLAELQRVARQVRKIRKEVNAPTCEVDAGYKTALNDVLDLLKEAKKVRANTIESLQDKYIPEPNSGCWLWEKCETRKGYGYTCIKGKKDYAYRIMYELYRGPIPQGMTLDHLCRVRCCVNPDHLEIVSNKENVLRGFGVTAMNARKTHCINGHPLSDGNLCKLKYGRSCKTCARIRARKYAGRKRGAQR